MAAERYARARVVGDLSTGRSVGRERFDPVGRGQWADVIGVVVRWLSPTARSKRPMRRSDTSVGGEREVRVWSPLGIADPNSRGSATVISVESVEPSPYRRCGAAFIQDKLTSPVYGPESFGPKFTRKYSPSPVVPVNNPVPLVT